MEFCFSIGISGAGKSTFYKDLLEDRFVLVEPDQIRKEMGDINDQSRGKEVFEEAYKRASYALSSGDNVYFSATNLDLRSIKELVKIAKEHNAEITAVIFHVSQDWSLCLKRVKEDIKNNVERSNTNVEVESNGETKPLVKVMSEKFKNLVSSKEFKDFIKDNNIHIINVKG